MNLNLSNFSKTLRNQNAYKNGELKGSIDIDFVSPDDNNALEERANGLFVEDLKPEIDEVNQKNVEQDERLDDLENLPISQADWNETNADSPSFIKNKPDMEEPPVLYKMVDGTVTDIYPGKNLIILSQLVTGSYNQATGLPSSGPDLKRNTTPVTLESGTSYVVSNSKLTKSMRFFFYDEDGGYISNYNTSSGVHKITIPSNATKMNYVLWNASVTNGSYTYWKLEKGDKPTIYTPAPSEGYPNAYPVEIGITNSSHPSEYEWRPLLNAQPDWNETDTSSSGYIKNKPSLPMIVTLAEPNVYEGAVTLTENVANFKEIEIIGLFANHPVSCKYTVTSGGNLNGTFLSAVAPQSGNDVKMQSCVTLVSKTGDKELTFTGRGVNYYTFLADPTHVADDDGIYITRIIGYKH